jgi:molybdopterin converting factor small subunit
LASIEMLGPLRPIASKELTNSLGRCKNLRELLSSLLTELRAYPDYGQLNSVEELLEYLIVLVNGSIAGASIIDVELGAGDRVTILPISHGG